MRKVASDTWVALFLLLLCGVFFSASLDIRATSFGQMESATWPRVVLTLLTVLSLIFLAQSLRQKASEDSEAGGGFVAWLASYKNAFACYFLFFLFLVLMPVLGMLIGGVLFVFGMLTVLGEKTLANAGRHAVISLVAVGLMWSIFTFGLRVILPQGTIFTTL